MSSFGFAVRREPADIDGPDQWKVSLPEQHDAWTITGRDYYDSPLPHADAVAALERFIAEANEALTALRAEKEFPND